MSKSAKRYWKYELQNEQKLSSISTCSYPHSQLNDAFARGEMKVIKKADEEFELEDGQLFFDNETGRTKAQMNGTTFWGKPSVQCPDCNGRLHINKKFFKIGSPHSPWFYICSNRDNGCKTVVPSKKSGELSYAPVDAKLRNARKLTSEMFERLWRDAPDIATWVGPQEDMNKVINDGKARAYRFLAHKMVEKGLTKNINNMSIDELRIAYAICRDSDLNDVVKY